MMSPGFFLNPQALRDTVRARGIKVGWLAHKSGVSERTMSRWLRGATVRVRAENLRALSGALECSPESLLRPAPIVAQWNTTQVFSCNSFVELIHHVFLTETTRGPASVGTGFPINLLTGTKSLQCAMSAARGDISEARAMLSDMISTVSNESNDTALLAYALSALSAYELVARESAIASARVEYMMTLTSKIENLGLRSILLARVASIQALCNQTALAAEQLAAAEALRTSDPELAQTPSFSLQWARTLIAERSGNLAEAISTLKAVNHLEKIPLQLAIRDEELGILLLSNGDSAEGMQYLQSAVGIYRSSFLPRRVELLEYRRARASSSVPAAPVRPPAPTTAYAPELPNP